LTTSDITFTSSTGFSTATFCTQGEKKKEKRRENSKIVSRKWPAASNPKISKNCSLKFKNRKVLQILLFIYLETCSTHSNSGAIYSQEVKDV
jgi:hypothetical protein